jgi:proteic killer suppression protein
LSQRNLPHYTVAVIKNFRHKGLERLFRDDDRSGVSAKDAPRLLRQLDRLDAATQPEDMGMPGWGLHQLKGDRKGTWSVKVSGNWRLTFRFADGDACDVSLEDYH